MANFFNLFPDVQKQGYWNRNLPTTIGGGSIGPYQNRPLKTGSNFGRSILDNIYGLSTRSGIQANPPSRFRPSMFNERNLGLLNDLPKKRNFTRTGASAFVDPNINDPMLRNYPALRNIPAHLRKYAKIVDGQVVFELPEELETPETKRTEGFSSLGQQMATQDQFGKGILAKPEIRGYSSQGEELADQGLLSPSKKEDKDIKPKMTMKGLLDKAVQFATSDFGKDFFMGMDTGYSKDPKTLMQTIQQGYDYATKNELAREKLDIERTNANKMGGEQGYLYTVTDPNSGNTYNATWDKKLGKAFVNIDGKRVPYAPDMFGGDKTAQISTAGNISKSNLTANAFFDLRNDLNTQENSLRKMADYLEGVQDVPSGMEKLAVKFGATINSILGDNDLTMDQLTQRINEGTFQSLIGANRLEVVGGGVMTEQDALRIISALGGDPANLTSNPEVITALISKIFADKYRLYHDNLESYNIEVESGGFSKYKKREPIIFSENQLSAIDPNKVLELNLDNIANFSESQLGRIKLDDLTPKQLEDYEKRMRELGLIE